MLFAFQEGRSAARGVPQAPMMASLNDSAPEGPRPRRFDLSAGRLLLARILVFGLFYWALLALGIRLVGGEFRVNQLLGLAAALLATVLTRVISLDRQGIGLAVAPRQLAVQVAAGFGLAVLIVGGGDLAVDATTRLDHGYAGRFPWLEVLSFYLPAAMHEELLFRGYVFQRVAGWNRAAAVIILPLLFAAAHLNNPAVSAIALANIALAGVLLSLSWFWFESLWLPISLHFFWNVLVGPVLGYRVSGLGEPESILTAPITGPVVLTGGAFGIEASAWVTVAETVAIALLLYKVSRRTGGRMAAGPAPAATEEIEHLETQ